MKEFIFIDGERFKEKFPLRSICYGEGVFETFRWKSRLPVFWNKHVERMRNGAGVLEIPFPKMEDIRESVEKAVLESKISVAYVKICLLSKGSSIFYEIPQESSLLVIVREFQPLKEPVKAYISSFRRNSKSPILGIKSLNYLENVLARREARSLGFDEAIFVNEAGRLAEGSTSNIFWLKEGILFTPSLECGLLPGVIRGVVIEIASELGVEVREGQFDLDSLRSSQGGFFTNSLIGSVIISQIDGSKLTPGSENFKGIRTALLEKLGW
jgi:4-amino-4-deoxychorismate lyase